MNMKEEKKTEKKEWRKEEEVKLYLPHGQVIKGNSQVSTSEDAPKVTPTPKAKSRFWYYVLSVVIILAVIALIVLGVRSCHNTRPPTVITMPTQGGEILLNPAPIATGSPLSAEYATYSLQYLAPYATPRGTDHSIANFSRYDYQRGVDFLNLGSRAFSDDAQFTAYVTNAFKQSPQFSNAGIGEALNTGSASRYPVILVREGNNLYLYRVMRNGQMVQIAYGPIVTSRFQGKDPGNPGENWGLSLLIF